MQDPSMVAKMNKRQTSFKAKSYLSKLELIIPKFGWMGCDDTKPY